MHSEVASPDVRATSKSAPAYLFLCQSESAPHQQTVALLEVPLEAVRGQQ
jgi:hypothetical protein